MLRFRYHGNFAGPGNDLIEQIAEGITPEDQLDFASLLHDIDYGNSAVSTLTADRNYLDRLDKIPGVKARLAQLGFTAKNFFDTLTGSFSDILTRGEYA